MACEAALLAAVPALDIMDLRPDMKLKGEQARRGEHESPQRIVTLLGSRSSYRPDFGCCAGFVETLMTRWDGWSGPGMCGARFATP